MLNKYGLQIKKLTKYDKVNYIKLKLTPHFTKHNI